LAVTGMPVGVREGRYAARGQFGAIAQ
jgi:hypothetical protein